MLYLLHHPQLGAVKVGITGHAERIHRFEQRGWNVQHALLFPNGAAAWTVEQAVPGRIRADHRRRWRLLLTGYSPARVYVSRVYSG